MATSDYRTLQTLESQLLQLKSGQYVFLKIRKTVSKLQNNIEYFDKLVSFHGSPEFGKCSIELWYEKCGRLHQQKQPWTVEIEIAEVCFAKDSSYKVPDSIKGQGVGSYILNELVKFVVLHFPASLIDREVQLNPLPLKDFKYEETQKRLDNWYAEWGLYPNERVSKLKECKSRYLDKGILILLSEDIHNDSLLKHLRENQRISQNAVEKFRQLYGEIIDVNLWHQRWRASFIGFAIVTAILLLIPIFTNLSVVVSITKLVSISYIVFCFFFCLWSKQYY